nr:synaptobrevin, longin-like domain protein [Tanacetum cinerariifolium]
MRLGGDYGNVFLMGFNGIQCNTIMERLQFCDYHNMVTILEKSEHNIDFHPMVDFIEASPLRIETTEEGIQILATMDGIHKTVTESSHRRNLKLKDEEGISSLPNTELFENLTLMGYNISPNQKFTFQKGQFSHQWKYLIHTIMQCLSPKSTGFNEFSSNIATALVFLATNRTYNFSKIIFDGLVKNVNTSPSFSGRIVPLFDTILVQHGEGSCTPTEPHHTPSPEAQSPSHTTHTSPTLPPVTTTSIPTVTPSDTPIVRQYTRRTRIAQSSVLSTVADKPASPLRDVSQGEACPTDSGFIADQARATIDKSSTLPHDSEPRITSPAAAQEVEINRLKEIVKMLEDREGVAATRSRDDAPIKGRSMDEGEAATERISDDSEEMATVLTSMDAATILASGVVDVPTGSGSIPTASTHAEEQVPTGSDVVSTASPVFATATVVTPYRRRKGKEVMRRSEQIARDVDIAKIHAEEELQIMIDGLDRNNETVAKYLQEYHQFASELPIERRIELITDLVKSNLGWKVKDFKGMTFKEVEGKFNSVWKQMEDFIPMGSKEEAERIKRKGLSLEQESVKKQKISEEVTEEAKTPDEVLKEKVKEMMQLVPIKEVYVEALQVKHPIIDWKVYHDGQKSYWKITRLGGSSASYQFFIDLLKHLDREELNQLWRLVKETLSNIPPTSDKEMELWVELIRLYEADNEDQLWSHIHNFMHAPVEWKLYDSCRVHHVTSKDKEIFMLVKKDYPLRKGLALVMISYKLQVKNYSQMANDLILKIYKIVNSPRQQAIVLASGVVDVPTGSGSIPTASTHAEEVQEQIDDQVARELEEKLEKEDQRRSKQIARDEKIAKIHAEEELQIMIDGLDRNNETVAKYLQEYHQFASELPIERRIELITDLVKSNLGWKVKDFKGMTFEEVEAKFNSVWKQMEDFIPMSSKEEAERIKRKGLSLEQESVKKQKISEEVTEEAKTPDEVPEEKVKEMMQLVPIEEVCVESLQVKHPIIDWKVYHEGQRSYWKITRLGGSSVSYQFFIDLLKHLDREDLNQL